MTAPRCRQCGQPAHRMQAYPADPDAPLTPLRILALVFVGGLMWIALGLLLFAMVAA